MLPTSPRLYERISHDPHADPSVSQLAVKLLCHPTMVQLSSGSDGYRHDAGLWLFGANDSYFPATTVFTQAPMGAFQMHLSYNLRPQLWAALDATYYVGGRATRQGVPDLHMQSNSRFGATLVLPVADGTLSDWQRAGVPSFGTAPTSARSPSAGRRRGSSMPHAPDQQPYCKDTLSRRRPRVTGLPTHRQPR